MYGIIRCREVCPITGQFENKKVYERCKRIKSSLRHVGIVDMIVMVIGALFYLCLPWYVQSAIWLVNIFIPDSIPFFDELLMFVPIACKIKKIITVSEFLRKYGIVLAVLLGIGIIALIVYLIVQ